jgi:PAS domain S-box-containing protein
MADPPPDLPKELEVIRLVRQLQEVDQRLQALTHGEVDAVISSTGQYYLLRQAQTELLQSQSRQRALAEALEAEQLRLNEAQATAKIGSWSLDLVTDELKWSDEMYRIYEIDRSGEQPLPVRAFERTHPEDRDRTSAARIQARTSSRTEPFQVRLLMPGNVIKWIEQRSRVEYGGHGVVIRSFGTTQDVTQRAQAERALRESRAQLEVASRLGRIGGWSADMERRALTWSEELCALYELAPGSSPTLEGAIEFYHPSYREIMRRASREAREHGTSYDLEVEIVTARGRRVPVRSMGRPERDSAGKIYLIHGAVQDLSDLKRAEEEARRLATQLASTLEGLTLGFFTVDLSWRVTYFNAAAEGMLGRDRNEVIGHVLWDLFDLFRDSECERNFRAALTTGRSTVTDVRLDAASPWIRAMADPSEGGLAFYLRDVTVEREALHQLQLLEAGVARISDVILITEASPLDEPGPAIQFVNDAFFRVTGYSREEVIGVSPRFLQGPETDRGQLDHLRRGLSKLEPVRAELINYTKDGTPFWVEMEIVPVAERGNTPTHFVAIERDITARKRDEEALRRLNTDLEARVQERTAELTQATRAAEEANRAKSTFLATMSHEIRTPMNGVIGLVDVLAQSTLQPRQAAMVGIIRESADALLRMIDDLLDFSKIEAGKLELETAPLRLGQSIERTCQLLDSMAAQRSVSVTMFVDPRIPDTVLGDEFRWRQILLNLLGNAIKFSAGRATLGRVAVRAELAERGSEWVTVVLTVADNGIGMDQTIVDRLFTPFSQADQSTTRRFGGTGLGLAIVRALVQLMGGEVSVLSEPMRGSTFAVRMSFAARAELEGSAGADPRVSGLRCRIIGTDESLAADLSRYLVHGGAQVECSPDLQAALDAPEETEQKVWLFLPDPTLEMGSLRATVAARPGAGTRYVLFEHGRRRRAHRLAPDAVQIDIEVLSRGDLLNAVGIAAGRVPEDKIVAEREWAPARAAALAPLVVPGVARILVAEDLDTNRAVLARQLEILGVTAEFASDGKEALERWQSDRFSLVLTDLRMPELDGYGLTAAIRAEEAPAARTAIIALTANALPEEERRCREAGMNDYLVKPVRLPRLRSAIEQWIGGLAPPKSKPGPTVDQVKGDTPVDLSVLRALVGDDPAAVQAVLKKFRGNTDRLGTEILQATQSGNILEALGPAHKLKSGARAVGAQRLGQLCAEIEVAAEALTALVPAFTAELAAVRAYLDVGPV